MEFRIVPGYDRKMEVSVLFEEYTRMLIAGEPEMAPYLKQQGYEEELAHLEEKYGYPDGRFYIALVEERVVGCIALRRLDEVRCELKRLYVLPEMRGCGIARALTRRLIADARAIGYRQILLDTLPFLREAIALYESEGFCRVEKYNDSPVEKTYFYRLTL
jgi:GNAT superfamily N-acetyltransferase